MRSYTIRVGAATTGANNFIEEINDYSDISININPTSFGDWEATIPYDPSIEDYILEEVYIIDDNPDNNDPVLFTGVLETVSSDPTGSATTQIGGRGIFIEEDYESRSFTVENSFLRDEIKNFASQYISFNTSFIDASQTSDTPFNEDGGSLSDDITNFGVNSPLTQGTDSVYIEDVALNSDFTQSEFDIATTSGDVSKINGDNYSQTSAFEFGGSSGTHTAEFNLGQFDYTVPVTDNIAADVPVRYAGSGVDEIRVYIDSDIVRGDTSPPSEPTWDTSAVIQSEISADTDVTLRIEVDTSDTSTAVVDCLSVHDSRYDYTLPTSTNENGVYAGPELKPLSFGIDFAEKGSQASTKASANFEVDAYPDSNTNLTDFTADFTGGIQAGGTETITDTQTTQEDTEFATFDATFSDDANDVQVTFYADVQPDYETRVTDSTGDVSVPAIFNATITPFEAETLTFIQEKEYSGSDAEIYKELHNDSVYEFAIDYDTDGNTTINTFPQGQKTTNQTVRTEDYTREIDYSEYANKVTVRTNDANGNTISATKKNSGEIERIGRTVHRTFSKPSLSTQTEIEFAAANKLDELLLEGNQSGSIEAVPTRIKPGYNYGWTPFNDKFTNGGTMGDAGLLMSADSDLITDTAAVTEDPSEVIFECLVWANIASLDDEEYQVLVGSTYGRDGDFIRVYGDGSVEVCQPSDEGGSAFYRSIAGQVVDRDVTRLTVHMNTTAGEGGVYFDGGVGGSPDLTIDETRNPDIGHIRFGESVYPNTIQSTSTQPSVWYRLDAYDNFRGPALSYNSTYENGDKIVDIQDNHNATVDDVADYVTYEPRTPSGGGIGLTFTGTFTADDGNSTTFAPREQDLSFATRVAFPTEGQFHYVFTKGRARGDGNSAEGHALFMDDTGLLTYEICDGTSTQTLKGNETLGNATAAVGVTLDHDGQIKLWRDGQVVDSAEYAFTGIEVGTTAEFIVGNDVNGNAGLDGIISDFAYWSGTALPDVDMEAYADYDPNNVPNPYIGGLDDVRIWDGTSDIDTIVENPYTTVFNSAFDDIRDELEVFWSLDSYNASQKAKNDYGIYIWDEGGQGDAVSLYEANTELYVPDRGTLEEISISIGRGSASMSLNLNLSRRVDANLSQAINDIDEVRKLL